MRLRLVTFSFVLLAAMPAIAAPPAAPAGGARLTIADAASRALARFPSVRASRARVEVASRELGEAKAARFPTLSAAAHATVYEEPMVVTPIHGFTPGNQPAFDDVLLRGSLNAEWLLLDGGARGARIDQRGYLEEAVGADAASTEQSILSRTIATYLRVLSTSATLAAHDRRLEALEAESNRVQQLREAGRAAEVDVRRAEATEASAEAERVRLASTLEVAERELARLIGDDPAAIRASNLVPLRLADAETPARETLRERVMEFSPAVRAAERRSRAAASVVTVQRSARWPTLSVLGSVLGYGSNEDPIEPVCNAGLEVQLPLFTGGAIGNRIGQSRAARDAAEAELQSARERLEDDLDRAYAAAEEARARTVSLDVAVAQFREVARIEQLRLDAETGTQPDWLEAQAELLVTEAQLAEARHSEIAARAELARLAGELNESWIAQNLEALP